MTQQSNKCIDEYGNIHIQDEVLGQGGQGIVFRTKDSDIAIKLVTDESGEPVQDKLKVSEYSDKLHKVQFLPLPEGLNISMPVAILQNKAGYVMQLLSEMIPLSDFWLDGKAAKNIAKEEIPEWLSVAPESEISPIVKQIIHYRNTGGLRQRLMVLYKAASLLSRLHGAGLVYGDISPNNIFASEGVEDLSVWLIDADNIRFETESGGAVVYTPRYGAPEICQNKGGIKPSSDCYSFAIVAFYLLSLVHPFIGKKAEGEDGGDWADSNFDDGGDSEDMAYNGFLPWVDDQNDDTNSSEDGLPRSLILTDKLRTLFESTFEQGRKDPSARPPSHYWPEAFAQAADETVVCCECNMSFYHDFIHPETEMHSCPYCKSPRPKIIVFKSYRWSESNELLEPSCWQYIREVNNDSKITIPRRVFGDFMMTTSDERVIDVTVSENSFLIEKIDYDNGIDLLVATSDHNEKKFQKIQSKAKVEINQKSSSPSFWLFSDSDSSRLVSCLIIKGEDEA